MARAAVSSDRSYFIIEYHIGLHVIITLEDNTRWYKFIPLFLTFVYILRNILLWMNSSVKEICAPDH